jgi:putative spermidine/putrescine transport system permease protein
MLLRAERGALRVVLLLLYTALTLLPLLAGWVYSLGYSLGMAGAFSQGFTLQNWQRLLPGTHGGQELLQTLGYSTWLAGASLAGVLILALGLSYAVVFSRPGRGLYAWLFLPLTLPPVVAAFAAYLLLNPAGLLSRLGYAWGWIGSMEAFPRLVNDAASLGIILTHCFLLAPFFSLVFVHQAGLERIPELRRLSLSLGCSARAFFARVYAPLLLRRNLPLILLYGVYLLGTYEIPLLLGRSAPRSISVYITEQLTRFDTGNFALGHAAAVLYALLVALSLVFFLRLRAGQLAEQDGT